MPSGNSLSMGEIEADIYNCKMEKKLRRKQGKRHHTAR